MNRPFSKLNQKQQEQTVEQTQTQQQPQGREFANVEEMLRFDSTQTPVPGQIAQRLQKSVDREQISPPKPWWKRLFGS